MTISSSHERIATEDFDDWLESRREAHTFEVTRVPFAGLDGWHFDARTGNLGHRSGRFFTIEGVRVQTPGPPVREWHQPIIVQHEIGILGILVKRFNGALHCLMQAKMEPGNPNLLQLSPTVQATHSNYTRVHQGAPVRYLEFFQRPERDSVIADVLQSEHGWWFHGKRNRNMIVETTGDVPLHEDFRWLTIEQVNELLKRDNVVNMDSRSVLANLPSATAQPGCAAGDDAFGHALAASRDPLAGSRHSLRALMTWIVGQRSGQPVRIARAPLRGLPGWYQTPDEIGREDGRHFRVVGVSVRAGSREVSGWSQPLLEPVGLGLAAFIVAEFDGVLHILMHVKVEGGLLDAVELGPTVQCRPGNYDEDEAPFFLRHVLSAEPWQIRFDTIHSEEGGRFLNAENRYLIVEAGNTLPDEIPTDFAWFTLRQLGDLLRHGGYIQVQARTLIACMSALG